MANSNTYLNGTNNLTSETTTYSQVQSNGLLLPVPNSQFIDTRAPGKLELLFNTGNNSEVIYTKNKPQDLYLKGLVRSQLSPPFYVNPNQGQRQKIGTSRTFPVEAALRDTTRITRFLGSSKGLKFIGTQLILQGFQTFDETKVYNPASPILAAFWPASFGLLNRPQRFIDTSNIIGGLINSAGLGGIINSVGGLFGAKAANPPPPRSTVASAASEPKSGLGGFFNITGILGGGDKTDVVMPITNQSNTKGLLRGNTATNAYNGVYYSQLIPPSGGGFFGNLLKAAGSFLKNNTLLGGILPPTQPIAGLKYRADENTYTNFLYSNRWSAFVAQSNGTNRPDAGNFLLFTSTPGSSKGGLLGSVLKFVGLQLPTSSPSGVSGMRFFASPLSNTPVRSRLVVTKTTDNRNSSLPTIGYQSVSSVAKLSIDDTTKLTPTSINSVPNSDTNKYGDLVKIAPDTQDEYSDQLYNYGTYTLPDNIKFFKTTFSDKTQYLVKELEKTFTNDQEKVKRAGYSYALSFGKPQQFLDNDIGFSYITKVKSAKKEKSNPSEGLTYQSILKKNKDTIKFPNRLGDNPNIDRLIRPTNDIDYVNSLDVMNQKQFDSKYNASDKWNGLGPDFVKFYFYDVVNSRYIPFNATIKGLQENNIAFWDPIEYLGRPDKLYYYKNFQRDLNFSFKVVANSVQELMPMWQRVNYLTGLTRPANYTSTVAGGFMIPPMVQLTLGDFYKNHFVVITSCNISIPEDASWELISEEYAMKNEWSYNIGRLFKNMKGRVAQFPREVEITLNMYIMEKDRPKTGRAIWGDAPVSTINNIQTVDTGDNAYQITQVDNYTKDPNIENNTFSVNVRYDVDKQGVE